MLANIIQAVLVICIHFFTKFQNAAKIDVNCSLPPDSVINYLVDAINNNHKNFTMDYRKAYYKTQDKTLNCWNIYFYIMYYYASKTTMCVLVHIYCYQTML